MYILYIFDFWTPSIRLPMRAYGIVYRNLDFFTYRFGCFYKSIILCNIEHYYGFMIIYYNIIKWLMYC